jgi:lysophospholipase L1-like esterase
MRLGRIGAIAALALACAAGAGGALYFSGSLPKDESRPVNGERKPLPADERPRTVALAFNGDGVGQPGLAPLITPAAAETPAADSVAPPAAPAASPAAAEGTPPTADDDSGDVTPTLEGRIKRPLGKRGVTILHIGDSHTAADFLTGELRRRLQARYGPGAPGYLTAGHPHIGVRTSSLKVTASSGWSYRSLQKADAVAAEFWLSGYNAVASAAGETLVFTADRPQTFDMIEIEVVRQPGGGTIDVKLDGVVEIHYDLNSSKIEPVVIRLTPSRGPTEKMRDITIATAGSGTVMVASVAIYNKQSGLTYHSVGYPGAQASLLNKFTGKLFANDLIRLNPQVVVLAFGTNEAANENLDVAQYAASYERVVNKIKSTLPNAAIVVIGPPDFAELPAACRKDKGSSSCAATKSANAAGPTGTSDCVWRTPAKLAQVREAQHEIATRYNLAYWNWASIMPSECGAHRWLTASPPLMAKDHVHFTVEGYKKSAAEFLTTLVPVIEKVRMGANAVPNN